MVLLVLISSEGKFLDLALSLSQVLGSITKSSVLSINLRFELSDSGLHLHHGLLSSLKGVDFSLISTGLRILALSFHKFAIPLKGHGHILLTAEFISKSSSINHSSSSLLLRHLGLIAHLIHVSIKCAELILKLPLSSSNGLVLVGKVSQGFIAVSKFLLQRSAGTVSLFQHSSSFSVSIDLSILGNSLHASFLINLDLGITNLVLVLLDGGLSFQSTSIGSFKSQVKFHDISFKFLLHSEGLSLALRFSLNSRLHRLKSLGLVLSDGQELLILLSNAALNFSSDLGQFKLATENLVFFLFKSGLSFLKGSLQLKFFSLKALADFVNLVDGATTLADLVHDVLDFIGQGLVFTADFIKLKHGLLIGRLDLEEVR